VLNPQDLQRLVEIITEEVMAAQRGGGGAAPCTCHAVRADCCPDRLRVMLDAGATRLGMHAAVGATLLRELGSVGQAPGVSSVIDHTLLKADATRDEIEKLCREAAEFHFATVCVNPAWVALASARLRGTGVGVCSVVGFPLGATTAEVKNFETRRAIYDGATEIDMVINVGALKSGDLRTVERDIEAVTDPCRQCGVVSKVIIEAALLTDEEKVTACTLSKAAGADFVKTSTGFGPGGATAADVALMRRVVGAEMGVKAAGGVRDLEGLKAMVAAGASRVGASAGVKIVQESRGQATAPSAASGY
jgi:deoxyribose-phosphate aldolase